MNDQDTKLVLIAFGILFPSLGLAGWTFYYMTALFGPRNRKIMSRFITGEIMMILSILSFFASFETVTPMLDHDVRRFFLMVGIIGLGEEIGFYWAAWHLWWKGLHTPVGKKWD